jgi:nickel-type superoxide dismutase maturation protease
MLGFSINRVQGMSMHPRLPHDSFILLRSIHHRLMNPTKCLKVGDTVKCNHPKYGVIIKTITSIDPQGFYWLVGEHESSITSEQIGPVPLERIMAQVIFSIK